MYARLNSRICANRLCPRQSWVTFGYVSDWRKRFYLFQYQNWKHTLPHLRYVVLKNIVKSFFRVNHIFRPYLPRWRAVLFLPFGYDENRLKQNFLPHYESREYNPPYLMFVIFDKRFKIFICGWMTQPYSELWRNAVPSLPFGYDEIEASIWKSGTHSTIIHMHKWFWKML